MRVEIYTNSHFEEIKFGELLRLKYGGWISKESAWSAGDLGSVPGLERCLGGWHSKPLQYSWLENSMDRGTLRATVHGVARVGHD